VKFSEPLFAVREAKNGPKADAPIVLANVCFPGQGGNQNEAAMSADDPQRTCAGLIRH
jgi:hypothetical protein